jgi:hypothetical protein
MLKIGKYMTNEFDRSKFFDQQDIIRFFLIVTQFRVDEIAIKKFPELKDKRFSDDEIFDLLTIALHRRSGNRKL